MSVIETTTSRPPAACQRWRRRSWLAAVTLTALISGCAGVAVRKPIDIHQPGWTIKEGQTTWTPGRNQEPITGDLLLATGPGKSVFVQLSKPPFTVVVATATQDSWQIDYPLRRKSLAGRSAPPPNGIWFRLARCCSEPVSARPEWKFVRDSGGRWQLSNRRTGEQLEGFFNP